MSKNDRRMTEAEFKEFDEQCTMERYRMLLIDLNERLEALEAYCGELELRLKLDDFAEGKRGG